MQRPDEHMISGTPHETLDAAVRYLIKHGDAAILKLYGHYMTVSQDELDRARAAGFPIPDLDELRRLVAEYEQCKRERERRDRIDPQLN